MVKLNVLYPFKQLSIFEGVCCIYAIWIPSIKKFYVGSTVNLVNRNKFRVQQLKLGIHNGPMQAEYNKYGYDDFKIMVLQICKPEELEKAELAWYNFYHGLRMCCNSKPGKRPGPTKELVLTENARANFEKHVIKQEGCWGWTGGINGTGYPCLTSNGRLTKSSAISLLMNGIPIPPGMNVLHKCDNIRCTNPDHLFLGTHSDNRRDMLRKGRHNRGMTFEKAAEIRKLAASGMKRAAIAAKLDVSRGVVDGVVTGKTWAMGLD